MAKQLNNAKMTVSGTPGTGDPTLLAAVARCLTFAQAGALDGDELSFRVDDSTAWGFGTCIYHSAGPSLTLTYSWSSAGLATALTLTSAAIFSAVERAEDLGQPSMTGDQTVTNLSADTNNWALTNQIDKSVFHIGATAAVNITGIAAGAAGQLITLINETAFLMTFKVSSASSTAANRLLMAADVALSQYQALTLWYDPTNSRWRQVLSGPGYGTNVAFIRYRYTGKTGTTLSGVDSNSLTMQYTPGSIELTKNGFELTPGTDYTATNGSSITLLTAAVSTDEFGITAFTALATGGYNTVKSFVFGALGAQSAGYTISGADDNGQTLALGGFATQVFKNGRRQVLTNDYTLTSTSVTMVGALVAGDNVTIDDTKSSNLTAVTQAVNTADTTMATMAALARAYIPQCGRLTYVGTTAVKFAPFNGDIIKINGVLQAIPSAGIAGVANTSVYVGGVAAQNLAASSVYAVFAFMNGSTVTADFVLNGTHAPSSTTGNVGVEIKTGDDTRTYLGMIRTNGSSQFVDSVTQRFVVSWFNKRNIPLMGASVAGASSASTSDVELNTAARIEFLTEADDAVSVQFTGFGYNTSGSGQVQTNIGIDSATAVATISAVQQLTTANDFAPASVGINKALAVGYHYATPIGHVNLGTGNWFGALSAMIRG